MDARPKGNCYLCGAELGAVAMKNHILKVHRGDNLPQTCRLLKIEGAYDKNYWLYADVPLDKALSTVDSFLRKIWLECCGHMSAFSDAWRGGVGKARKFADFPVGTQLLHDYDFGSTTETLITAVGDTTRQPQHSAVRLLARNVPLSHRCANCGKTADYVCAVCMDGVGSSFFCQNCAEQHEHECLLPVTNSPRMGMCGYMGELDRYDLSNRKALGQHCIIWRVYRVYANVCQNIKFECFDEIFGDAI